MLKRCVDIFCDWVRLIVLCYGGGRDMELAGWLAFREGRLEMDE